MPICKYCGSRIEKFHKNDICPVCGHDHPFGDDFNETMDITACISDSNDILKNYHPKSKLVAFFLSLFLGFISVPFFYIKKIKIGIISLLLALAVIVGIFAILYFVAHMELSLSIIIALAVGFIYNIILGLYFLLKTDLKDGNDNLLN